MDAAVSGNVPIARELLKQGANPNLLNSKGRTALHSAVISANTDMVSLLLKSGADPDIYGSDEERLSALDLALRRWASEDEDDRVGGVSNVLELMIKKGMPTDRGTLNETALDLATDGNADAIAFLRKQGFNVNPNQLMSNGASYLFILAGTGDDGLESAKLLLELGADPNYKSPAGLSVLSLAVRNGAAKQAKALLAAGADVMARNNAGALAYDLAAIYGHDELAQILITQMNRVVPDVDKQDSTGDTALMRAVKKSDTKAVSDLLTKCADASRRDLHGDTPLSFAVCRDMDEVVHLLRQAGAERLPGDCANNDEQMVFAGAKGALGSILDLLDSGVSINATDAKGDTALTEAEPHPGVVRVLAKRGADLSHRNQEGNTAYMIAAAATRTLMMQTLVEVGSPIDEPAELDGLSQMHAMLNALRSKGSEDDSAESDTDADYESDAEELLMASFVGDAIAVSRQIAAGTNVNYENDEGRTALMMALAGLGRGEMSRRKERDFEQVIDSLLVAGVDPNSGMMPPLIIASTTGRLHIVNALIRAGADVNAIADLPTDEHDGTMLANALFVALSQSEHEAYVDERLGLSLLRAGVDLSFTSDDGSIAAHCAAKAGMTNTLREILDRAPEAVDAQDNEGSTPLMLAAGCNRLETVRVLIERQADRGICDVKGRTAADHATANGHAQVAEALNQ
jgi:ankyrin repeat protein